LQQQIYMTVSVVPNQTGSIHLVPIMLYFNSKECDKVLPDSIETKLF